MKLTDLSPNWYSVHGKPGRVGVRFNCPHCVEMGVSPPEELYVPFANPLDQAEPSQAPQLWQRTGETFETLTLTPSVDASHFGHWHGFVRDGEIA